MSPEAKRKAAFVTNEGLFQFRVMPFRLCNAPATFERLMDRVLCGMRWSRCLVYLDNVISYGGTVTEALGRLEEVLCRLSNFGLQLKAKKCTFMQTEVIFLGHIVGRTGLACDPAKLAAVQNWHAPDKVKGVRQFVGFVGYYRRFVKDFCKPGRTPGGADVERSPLRMDRPATNGIRGLKGMPRTCPYPGFSHRRRTFCSRHGRQFVCCGRCPEPVTERWGSGNRIRQSPPAVVSVSILYNPPGDAGSGGNVYTLPAISQRCAIHPPNRS